MVEISSNVSSTMEKIHEAHWETGNETGSRAGYVIAMSQRGHLKKQRTKYSVEYKDGARKIVKNENQRRPFGTIVNKQGKTLSTRLENFIQWRTYSSTGTTVVAAPMKSGTTEIRKNGKVVKKTRVDSVGKGSIDILQKLNYGLNSSSDTIRKVNKPFDWQGGKSMSRFRGTHQNSPMFMEQGRRDAMGTVNKILTAGFSDALKRRENIKEPLRKVV